MSPEPADKPLIQEDLRLLSEVASVSAELDPVPETLLARIFLAVSLGLMEAELANIVAAPLVAARTEAPLTAETITFTASNTSLMITLSEDGARVRVDGWVTGAGSEVELHTGREVLLATADATGRLFWPLVAHGPVRFLIRPSREGAAAVVTPTIEV